MYSAFLVLHCVEFLVDPPRRYPDIYPVINVLISTPVFMAIWLWSIKSGVEAGWAIGGLGGGSRERRRSVSSVGSGSGMMIKTRGD